MARKILNNAELVWMRAEQEALIYKWRRKIAYCICASCAFVSALLDDRALSNGRTYEADRRVAFYQLFFG